MTDAGIINTRELFPDNCHQYGTLTTYGGSFWDKTNVGATIDAGWHVLDMAVTTDVRDECTHDEEGSCSALGDD